jgi:hypothetical protein
LSNRENIRVAITTEVARLASLWTEYVLAIETEGRSVDTATQTDPYLCLEITFQDGMQADLNTRPIHRIIGGIVLSAAVKKGEGSRKADRLLEHFYSAMQMTDRMSPARTYATSFLPTEESPTWMKYRAIIPFWADVRYP